MNRNRKPTQNGQNVEHYGEKGRLGLKGAHITDGRYPGVHLLQVDGNEIAGERRLSFKDPRIPFPAYLPSIHVDLHENTGQHEANP